MRQPLVMANWKMHGSVADNASLLTALKAELGGAKVGKAAECVVCPPFPYLAQVAALLADTQMELGGQDCGHAQSGAYTGEVAAEMLADLGCRWVIIGHSERRQYHQESDALLAAKVAAAGRAGLTPVVCVGETRSQREAGEAEDVVEQQLKGALGDLSSLQGIVVAYEPVWAIGTGLTATPDQAQDMHRHVRETLAQLDGASADAIRVLYGGSVKADNAAKLFAEDDIDGALVGGASLDAQAFSAILSAAMAR
jgi:triosephosphate isomerase